jgi:chromosome segregation ATPase
MGINLIKTVGVNKEMTDIIQTLQGTINRLKEDNEHLETQFYLENEKIHVQEKLLKEYKEARYAYGTAFMQNKKEIKKLEKYLQNLEEALQWA